MKNPDLTHRTLCRLLSSPADTTLTSTLGPDDWRLLAATAQREGVAPLLYHALKEQRSQGARELRSAGAGEISPQYLCSSAPLPRVPPDVQTDLRQAYYATTARNLLLYRELTRILAALTAPNPQYPIPNPSATLRTGLQSLSSF